MTTPLDRKTSSAAGCSFGNIEGILNVQGLALGVINGSNVWIRTRNIVRQRYKTKKRTDLVSSLQYLINTTSGLIN